MATYERVEGGQVVERDVTVDGSYEDTRLGMAAGEYKDGADGWRIQQPPADPASTPAAVTAKAAKTAPAGKSGD